MDITEYLTCIKIRNSDHNSQTGGRELDEVTEYTETKPDMDKLMLEDHNYPLPEDENIQYKMYVKKEFYVHKIPYRAPIDKTNKLKEYRKKCNPEKIKISETQALLSNIINPNTPYSGLLLFHGTGSGKTGAAVTIAEKFKPMVEKYGTRIHVLVPGPLHKQNFINEILKFAGDEYYQLNNENVIMTTNDANKLEKNAINIISRYYRVMSHRAFQKKVIGEKVRDKVIVDDKVKLKSRKTASGEYVRELSSDRIYSLDNTILIIDEAHQLTENGYGEAVEKIIESSKNLKIILLTATPMKNLADNFIDLLNFIRPRNHPIRRDKIFTGQRGATMEFKPSGKKYLRNMIRGYISYNRGSDPLTYPERIDMGVIPPELLFTKLIRCYMNPFQKTKYDIVIEKYNDSLSRNSEAVSNFTFPGLSKDGKNTLVGYYGESGMSEVKRQLRSNSGKLIDTLISTLFKDETIKDKSNLIYLQNNKTITGEIFNVKYLRHFSTKFYHAMVNINNTVYGKEGPGLLFVFSNLVRIGVNLFKEVLLMNGYLEYQESGNYLINDDTKCYYCGREYSDHTNLPDDIPEHHFHPATFVSLTGRSEADDGADQIPEEKFQVIKGVFNKTSNKEGKYIKLILGSKVMAEGITLANIKDIHILDVHHTLGRVDQVIGRGARYCQHMDVISEDYLYPVVRIYKYVVSVENDLSSEELMYKNAEIKYKLIKQVERIFQEEAIDCPILRNNNIFPEELQRYKDCGSKENPCPAVCGYMECNYICSNKILNQKYYDPDRNIYKNVPKNKLDYSTYDNFLAMDEINHAKRKIMELYRMKHIYDIDPIMEYVRNSYDTNKDIFDEFYVYYALDKLILVTANDFNNFTDIIYDKFNTPGYLIYRNKYYIFQPFDKNEHTPMYYRRNYITDIKGKISVRDYLASKYNNLTKDKETLDTKVKYDFDSVIDYYDGREEYKYIGVVDKTRKTNEDVFKIREKRPKILEKIRETGVPTYTGSVCATSKEKQYLVNVGKYVGAVFDPSSMRALICDAIRDRMFDLEKYSTTKDKNKLTYLIVPSNHPTIPFPLNLEDRIKRIIKDIKTKSTSSKPPKIDVHNTKGKFGDIKYVEYKLNYSNPDDRLKDILKLYQAEKQGDNYVISVS